jgi:hypothetical protein
MRRAARPRLPTCVSTRTPGMGEHVCVRMSVEYRRVRAFVVCHRCIYLVPSVFDVRDDLLPLLPQVLASVVTIAATLTITVLALAVYALLASGLLRPCSIRQPRSTLISGARGQSVFVHGPGSGVLLCDAIAVLLEETLQDLTTAAKCVRRGLWRGEKHLHRYLHR